MHEDTIEISLTPADTGETCYRMVNAVVSELNGSLAEASVIFEITSGPGGLGSEKTPAFETKTDEWGIAQVNWHAAPFPRSDPQSAAAQNATLRASTADERARGLKIHIAQTNWLPN